MNGSEPLAFEIKATDLGGRIGSVRTKSSEFETPALLPVIHPLRQAISCSELREMGFEAVMTNAYTVFRERDNLEGIEIHKLIVFDGTVMTDSGGYQVLEFGKVDAQPAEVARFEEEINSDIAIVLDRPTGFNVTRKHAVETVESTLAAAIETKKAISKEETAWMLPVQGGRYLDLIEKSAKKSSELEFDCYSLGSPVEVMEQYEFPLLVRMIVACKRHIPSNKPFHLFGAGHPLIIPLAVALGCDTFDSAAYMLYARNGRYISFQGTMRLENLQYLPCTCRVCSSTSPKELLALEEADRTVALARHNLWATRQIIEQTKQTIREGRLWELLKQSASVHPKVNDAFTLVVKLAREEFDDGTPEYKPRGIFIFDEIDLERPEVQRYKHKLNSIDLRRKEELVILPETKTKPFLASRLYKQTTNLVDLERSLIVFMCPNFGLVPAEISDVFPLSQFTSSSRDLLPVCEAMLLRRKSWSKIHVLLPQKIREENYIARWVYQRVLSLRQSRKGKSEGLRRRTKISISTTYRSFKLERKRRRRERISRIGPLDEGA